jgi:hypothetical protein
MAITLEETAHGIELEVGTPIVVKLLSKSGDQCMGYFKKIDDNGITICPSLGGCFSSDYKFDARISMGDIAEVSQIAKYYIYRLQIKRDLDTEQISK